MTDTLADSWWQKLGTAISAALQRKYVAALEEEVQRLRGENRALMNSLLGTAGFPPVEFPAAPAPRELARMRRRSWHQIQAWREAETVRSNGHASPSSTSE